MELLYTEGWHWGQGDINVREEGGVTRAPDLIVLSGWPRATPPGVGDTPVHT